MRIVDLKKEKYTAQNDFLPGYNPYVTDKSDFIQTRREVIKNMDTEIKDLTEKMKKMDPKDLEYKAAEKKLARCRAIQKDCEQSIYNTTMQMNLQTHPSFRSL